MARADDERERTGSRRGRLKAADAAKAGLRQIVELIGKKPLGVASVVPAEGGWLVGIEVVEDPRIPSSADILAVYEAEVDEDGSLVSYRRLRRYPRGQISGRDSSG